MFGNTQTTCYPSDQQRVWKSLQVQICEIFAKFVKSVKMQTTWIFQFTPGVSGKYMKPPIPIRSPYSKSQSLCLFPSSSSSSPRRWNFEIWEIIPNLSTAHATFVKTSSTQSKKTHFSFLPRRSQNWRPGNNRALFLTCRSFQKSKEL